MFLLGWSLHGTVMVYLSRGELVQVRESSAEQGKVHLVRASLPFSPQPKLVPNGQSFAMWLKFYHVAEVLPCGGSFNQAGEASSIQLKLLLLR